MLVGGTAASRTRLTALEWIQHPLVVGRTENHVLIPNGRPSRERDVRRCYGARRAVGDFLDVAARLAIVQIAREDNAPSSHRARSPSQLVAVVPFGNCTGEPAPVGRSTR